MTQRRNRTRLTPPVVQALREMHPAPFVQSAIWSLYLEAPGLLDAAPYVKIASAEGLDPQAMLDARPTTTQEA